MNETEFSEKWLNKQVEYRGSYYKIPLVKYKVTAALLNYDEGDITTWAIMSEHWNPPKNIDWFTFKLAKDELTKLDDFVIL